MNAVLGLCATELAELSWGFEGRVLTAVLGLKELNKQKTHKRQPPARALFVVLTSTVHSDGTSNTPSTRAAGHSAHDVATTCFQFPPPTSQNRSLTFFLF